MAYSAFRVGRSLLTSGRKGLADRYSDRRSGSCGGGSGERVWQVRVRTGPKAKLLRCTQGVPQQGAVGPRVRCAMCPCLPECGATEGRGSSGPGARQTLGLLQRGDTWVLQGHPCTGGAPGDA